MNSIPERLQLFVSDSLDPHKFTGLPLSDQEFESWRNFLSKEISAIKRAAIYGQQSKQGKCKTVRSALLLQIVNLSNTVHIYLTKYYRMWRMHTQAGQIRANYLYTCQAFEELIAKLAKQFPSSAAAVKISDFSLPQVKIEIKQCHRSLADHLKKEDIDPNLKELFFYGLSGFARKKGLRRMDVDYIQQLTAFLLNTAELSSEKFIELLITHDFNLPEFFHYCIDRWKRRLADIPGLHEQQEMLLTAKDNLYHLQMAKGLRMPGTSSSLDKDLEGYLSEKYLFLKELIKLRREVALDKTQAKAGIRFLMNLPVAQWGLFIRMQIEKGLLPKDNVGDLFNFFAAHFYTPHTSFVSAESLQKKSSDVEFSTAQKMKGHLIGMLNWLNSNFNLSNYS